MNSLGKAKWTLMGGAIALLGLATFVQLTATAREKGGVIPAANRLSELDQPIAWMLEAKRNYTAVKDYSCILATQENVNGKLQEQNIIQLKMKSEPFSVHMRWLSPKKSEGQEVAFVLGKNNGKMRVKSKILGAEFFVSIDPNDKRVMQHSRHTIVEAGIGNMIEQCLNQWEKDRVLGKTTVKTERYLCNGRECHKVELTRTEKNPAFYCHRTVIYMEKESKLPIRLDNFGWPTQGAPAGELLESFNYVNLQFNVGLKDREFEK